MSPGNQLAGDSKQAAPADLPEGTSSDWWSTVQKDIRDSEYHVTWQEKTLLVDVEAAWQAPNRSNNLRTYFSEDGVRVIPRMDKEPEWSWGLSLKGYGPRGDVQAVAKPTLVPSKNHMEYQRGERLTEWYVNDKRGLEQGFTLNAPPTGFWKEKSDRWIVLRMALYGNLQGTLHVDRNTIDFVTPDGVGALQYGHLHAFDATGLDLP